MLYKQLSSSALGDNALKLLPMPGRFIFDLFHEVKKGDQKFDSYSLNFVSQQLLHDEKVRVEQLVSLTLTRDLEFADRHEPKGNVSALSRRRP